MTDFYRVRAPSSQSWLWVGLEELRTPSRTLVGDLGPSDFWSRAERLYEGDVSDLLAPPLFLPLNYGKKRGDLLWTGGMPPLASERLVEALREGGVTGWSTYDVEVRYRRGRVVPGYVGLVVTGRTDRWFEGHVPWRVVDEEPRMPYAVGCDPGPGWDGSGVFTERGSRAGSSFWMSAQAVEVLRAAGVSDLELVPAELHEHLHGVPGLPEWPED